jgi:phosphoserine phosphatase
MVIRLVIFDVDGTILKTYCWQYIHENLGTWNDARGYFDQFFRNRITYDEWAKLDAALWKNQLLTRITEIISQMPYTEGAKETLATLREKGIETYLLSAGLTQVAQRIQEETGINGYAANTLVVKDGCLTGEVEVNVSFHDKDKHLPRILRVQRHTQRMRSSWRRSHPHTLVQESCSRDSLQPNKRNDRKKRAHNGQKQGPPENPTLHNC